MTTFIFSFVLLFILALELNSLLPNWPLTPYYLRIQQDVKESEKVDSHLSKGKQTPTT